MHACSAWLRAEIKELEKKPGLGGQNLIEPVRVLHTRPRRSLSALDKLLSLLKALHPQEKEKKMRSRLSRVYSSSQLELVRASHFNINLPHHCPPLLPTYLTDFYFYGALARFFSLADYLCEYISRVLGRSRCYEQVETF